MTLFGQKILNVVMTVLIFGVTSKGINAEEEGSGDVCNVDGSTCPEDKCCRQDACEKGGGESHCCTDPSSDPSCANCPTCGMNCSISLSNI